MPDQVLSRLCFWVSPDSMLSQGGSLPLKSRINWCLPSMPPWCWPSLAIPILPASFLFLNKRRFHKLFLTLVDLQSLALSACQESWKIQGNLYCFSGRNLNNYLPQPCALVSLCQFVWFKPTLKYMLLNRALLQELWGLFDTIKLTYIGRICKPFCVSLTKVQILGHYCMSSFPIPT